MNDADAARSEAQYLLGHVVAVRKFRVAADVLAGERDVGHGVCWMELELKREER